MLGARIVLAAMAAEAAMAFNCMSPATAFRSLSRVHSHPAPRSARLGLLRMAGGSPLPAADEKRREGSADKFALLFDCDGVIVLTEELHRLAYNGAFQDYSAEVTHPRYAPLTPLPDQRPAGELVSGVLRCASEHRGRRQTQDEMAFQQQRVFTRLDECSMSPSDFLRLSRQLADIQAWRSAEQRR